MTKEELIAELQKLTDGTEVCILNMAADVYVPVRLVRPVAVRPVETEDGMVVGYRECLPRAKHRFFAVVLE